MIKKGSKCIGCPFADKGDYFTPDYIVPDSKVLFIAQNPGHDEESGHLLIKRHYHGGRNYSDEWQQVQPQPLIGATGQLFNNRFLPLSGLKRDEVSVANSIRCRPGLALGMKPDDLPNLTTAMKLETSKADIVKALKHCRDAYLQIPSSVKLIVTMGRYAMFSMTGIQNEETEYGHKQGVVESWRGYAVDYSLQLGEDRFNTLNTNVYNHLLSDINVFITMHIAALNYPQNKKYYHAVLSDFHKIGLLLAGKWPKELPTWSTAPPTTWPKYAAFDTEYIPQTNELIRWSLCDTDNNLYCVEPNDSRSSNIPIRQGSVVLIQNALADIGHLSGIVDLSMVSVEDMMLAHSVLWTSEPHSLNYINSMYGAFNRYKHLSNDQPELYSALDAYEPMYAWRHHFIPEFKQDPLGWVIYKKYRLPLINIINKAQQTGAKVNTDRLSEVVRIYQDRLNDIQEQAQVITGDEKFKIGGKNRVMKEIYGE